MYKDSAPAGQNGNSGSDSAAYLLDALVETARGFERRASPRPVIVIVTSEGIDYSKHGSEPVLEALQASHVATHAIVLKDRATTALQRVANRER